MRCAPRELAWAVIRVRAEMVSEREDWVRACATATVILGMFAAGVCPSARLGFVVLGRVLTLGVKADFKFTDTGSEGSSEERGRKERGENSELRSFGTNAVRGLNSIGMSPYRPGTLIPDITYDHSARQVKQRSLFMGEYIGRVY